MRNNGLKNNIVKVKEPTFYFIGINTIKSIIMKWFPLWMRELEKPEISIEGIDLKINDKPDNFRNAVALIKYAVLVTTHKMDLYSATEDMFIDYFDDYALLLKGVSCISKNGRLEGYAKDPISSGLFLKQIIQDSYFKRVKANFLIFQTEDSSIATVLYLLNKRKFNDILDKIIFLNISKPRLYNLKEILGKISSDIKIEYICNADPNVNDDIINSLPSYKVVVNAIGMGKDIPRSPITNKGVSHKDCITWEFNYRDELDFLHQTEDQKESRGFNVEDGWTYFIHRWTQLIFKVLQLKMNTELFIRLKSIANNIEERKCNVTI
jgi:shikimate dehydrogenase